jgi:hypothetical protein
MSSSDNVSNTRAPTQFIQTKDQNYAYRRFGAGTARPLLCLQHFTGTLDNSKWRANVPRFFAGWSLSVPPRAAGRTSCISVIRV